MSHLEALLTEYLDWRGYLVRRNIKVGRLKHGGWEMELDVVGYHPGEKHVVHYEPSLDALSWERREQRYEKKFAAGRTHIFASVFPWLPHGTPLAQYAVFPVHPEGRDTLAGGDILSIDELMAQIRQSVIACGPLSRNAIPEQYPLLRTLQLTHAGYHRPR